jgi:DNA-binding HxlR family transcriptional regulator
MSKKKKDEIGELKQEIDILDHMLDALVETLEEKGVMTTEEWERKIKTKIEHAARTQQNFRDLESE